MSKRSVSVPKDEADDFYVDDGLFNISSWGADLSFRELVDRYDEGDLVKPELQRNYVWDKAEASRFIDSLLFGLPVPSIFLAKTRDDRLLIIDGYQRIMTVRDFIKGIFSGDGSIFRLSKNDRINSRWRGKAFLELSAEEQRRIRNATIHAIIFSQSHPASGDTSLFQVFERINSTGRTLLPQEIRNCVYQGELNSLLIKLNQGQAWRVLWGAESPDARMRDMEFILRFFALSGRQIWSKDAPSRISLKKYLNEFMDGAGVDHDIGSYERRFSAMTQFCVEHFGDAAFRNVNGFGEPVSAFSATVFDAVSIAVDGYLRLVGNAPGGMQGMEARRRGLLINERYQGLLNRETMRVPNIRSRVELMSASLFGDEPAKGLGQ